MTKKGSPGGTISLPVPPLVLPGRPADPGIKNVGEGRRPASTKPGTGRGGSGGGSSSGGGGGGSGTGSSGGGSGSGSSGGNPAA
jgi:hypothetical protein